MCPALYLLSSFLASHSCAEDLCGSKEGEALVTYSLRYLYVIIWSGSLLKLRNINGIFLNLKILIIMNTIAPDIFRKRLLIEGYFANEVSETTLIDYFSFIASSLQLRTYGKLIVHSTSGLGKKENQGYDAFVPLIDSGIYIGVWSIKKFLSLIIYTAKILMNKKLCRQL